MKSSDAKARIVTDFKLEALNVPVRVETLAKMWGVISIEHQPISSAGMLLPGRKGYKIILNERQSKRRQRFSLAHELGHLLLQKRGISGSIASAKYRSSDEGDVAEEQLCDQIAAEILMPRMAFYEDGWMEGWSLKSLRTLADKYDTSFEATAIRIVDLMPEEALLGVWQVSKVNGGKIEYRWSHRGATSYAIPARVLTPDPSLELIKRSNEILGVLEGRAPAKLDDGRPIDVPAEAMSYGGRENQKVMVFYYPSR